jgi:hypothetical protein
VNSECACEMHQSQTFVHLTTNSAAAPKQSRIGWSSTKGVRCEMHQSQTFVHLIRLLLARSAHEFGGSFTLKVHAQQGISATFNLCFLPLGALNAFLKTLRDSSADLPEI